MLLAGVRDYSPAGHRAVSSKVNWRAIQVPPYRAQGAVPVWQRPSDVLVKHMAGGSWHADGSKGGARRKRGGG